ncbi:4-hydroxy-tetrahydrodipicolinate synthase [Pseudoruminococcus massiliensis]|uniref:4-hydroxy-tetrahydrodipicolinate synthase n=1 Tax=Pseudoruminococcus massiliensis TaxID=2086583 RepID=UPI004028D217
MSEHIFEGSGVAIITPMNPDGSVNFDELGRIIDFQIENGTDAIITCGTTGESATLNNEEHCEVIEYTIKKVAHRVPVIAGAGSNDTNYAIGLSKHAQTVGADAILSVTPYYNKTSQAGLIRHYTAIADNVDIPIILYNVPSRTGCNIKPETYYELSKHPNIKATKEANGDTSALVRTMALCGDNLDVYSGEDSQAFTITAMGGKGVISVFANICPKESHELVAAALAGDFKKSFEMQKKYIKLMDMLFSDVNPIPIKEAMNMFGFNCGDCRLPLTAISESGHEALRKTLVEYGLI